MNTDELIDFCWWCYTTCIEDDTELKNINTYLEYFDELVAVSLFVG